MEKAVRVIEEKRRVLNIKVKSRTETETSVNQETKRLNIIATK